jgi:hypothetical protein
MRHIQSWEVCCLVWENISATNDSNQRMTKTQSCTGIEPATQLRPLPHVSVHNHGPQPLFHETQHHATTDDRIRRVQIQIFTRLCESKCAES